MIAAAEFGRCPVAGPRSRIDIDAQVAASNLSLLPKSPRRPRTFALASLAALIAITIAAGAVWTMFDTPLGVANEVPTVENLEQIVDRIVAAESSGDNKPNTRSTADGPAQFLAQTWIELVNAYRPDLTHNRSRAELLSMRRQPKLAREMTWHLLQRHAGMLRRRGFPVTSSTLYLAHFAGGAGAVAVLSAPKDSDAALVLARADASGRTTRAAIANANPFLDHYSVADLQDWAHRKVGQSSPKPGVIQAMWNAITRQLTSMLPRSNERRAT
jgi:hypothetical protein